MKWRQVLITGVVAIVLVILQGSVLDYFENFDKCVVNRYEAGFKVDYWGSSAISSGIFNLTQLMLYLLFLQMIPYPYITKSASLPSLPNSIQRWNTVFLVCYTIIWYCSTYFLCVTLKHWLSDSKCHTQPNSVSGHYNFHIFYGLSAIYLLVRLKRDPRSFRHYFDMQFLTKLFTPKTQLKTKVIVTTFIVFAVSTILTLTRTYLYGYHTPRQILYGSLLAVTSHLLLTLVLEKDKLATETPGTKSSFLLYILASFAVSSTLLVNITNKGIPFSTFEIIIGVLLILLGTYAFKVKLREVLSAPTKLD